MARKYRYIKQRVTLSDGRVHYYNDELYLDDTELASLVAQMEGEVKVYDLDETNSRLTGGDTKLPNFNCLNKVSLTARSMGLSYYFPNFNGKIILKETCTPDNIEAIFKDATPFIALPSQKVEAVKANISGGTILSV